MNRTSDKTINQKESKHHSPWCEEFGYGTTAEVSRKVVIATIPVTTRSYFKIIGFDEEVKIIIMEMQEIIIGRSHECGIHLPVNTVSRKHARVFFRNEEYCLEDLGSINGTYVNGIKVVRCVLRNNDQIDIGEMKMLFHEDQVLERNEKPS